MTRSFNLLDEPWIPVHFGTGERREIGLIELFKRANDITALTETSPPNLIALHRLLLAITHRALIQTKGNWKDRDRAEWYRKGLPPDALRGYLEQWRDRFWLFHPEHPFMQVAALAEAAETRDKTKPWTQITLDSANGNAPVVFDHSVDTIPSAILPAQALRNLLGFLQFTPGGLVKVIRGSDKAGALANTAAVLPLGQSLNQTLCLALHPSSRASEYDLPAWESTPPMLAALSADSRLATGPCDRYTRLSRAVLFIRDDDTSGIRHIRFAAGLALADDANAPDPMASYRIGTNGPVRVSFTEGRAVWRDLSSLMPDSSGKLAIPASVLAWAAALHEATDTWDAEVPVLVAGLASDQAKLLRWRSERFTLPAPLLLNPDAGMLLRQQLKAADDTWFRLRGIAADMIAETMPDPASKDTRTRARAVLDNGPCAAAYFANAERSLPRLLQRIANGEIDEADSHWRNTLAVSAQNAWEAVCRSLGQSTEAIRAEARTHFRLRLLLRELRGEVAGTARPTPKTEPSIEAEEVYP
ncbi:type I-E CRISPR-associated protein Cse1/CasA [Aromatoleum anaerobium]|uniref:Type I-E CRISPR-associated protein Cse1/CasA n=1 Tax=Aromatoleum anaerobium TaxID=182180 RepID=A0ABX1PM50_9RHOO|nr:type I-E CRISPR-associated protein Cse1/CasA [Aromatoleum anaerobium]MCK0506039.1 type I-E CRISPR-associated protein Cse1/CasA [Aromatoleum anaerobium]